MWPADGRVDALGVSMPLGCRCPWGQKATPGEPGPDPAVEAQAAPAVEAQATPAAEAQAAGDGDEAGRVGGGLDFARVTRRGGSSVSSAVDTAAATGAAAREPRSLSGNIDET